MLSKEMLTGKVAIVTGGSRGIGKAIAIALSMQGCEIAICARTESELRQAEMDIKKYSDAFAIRADVSKTEDVKRVVNKTIKKFKKINILVNNAGIGTYGPFLEMRQKSIDATLDINLKGVIYLTKEALPYIEKEGYGRVINISSGLGKFGMANFTLYCASKFGVIGFTEALAEELKNAKAYAVCPGQTNTRMTTENFPDVDVNSIDQPEDVAKVVLRLCMPNCNVKNGAAVDV